VLLLAILALISAPYLAIGFIMLAYGRKQTLRKDYSHRPTVTVFVPTYNEEKNIGRKLDNLLTQTYPISETRIYDSSTDNTARLVREYEEKHPSIKLITVPEDMTMAQILNRALREAKGEIVVKTDCDSLAKSRDALKELVADFADPRVGGVTGVCVAERGLEKYFRALLTRLQVAESNIDSVIIAHASSLLAFRKSAATPVSPDSMADDTEEFVLIRRKGYRTIVDAQVTSQEEQPRTFSERRTQKDRRAQGIARALIQNRGILFRPRYNGYGLIVYPANLFLLAISPILLIAGATLFVSYVLAASSPPLLLATATTLALVFAMARGFLLAAVDAQISGLVATARLTLGMNRAKWGRIR